MTDDLGEAPEEPPSDAATPSDAFQGLGDEARTAVVRALAEEEPRSFSQLHAASGVDTSAGFAYHLRQLDGRFVRQRDDEQYELTTAGREVARSIRSGVYTDSVDREPVSLADPCPCCSASDLTARVTDNVTAVRCGACGTTVLRLSLPPSGYATRADDAVPSALDSYYRHRIGSFSDGVCPDCCGTVGGAVEPATAVNQPDPSDAGANGTDHVPVQVAFECEGCGADLRCPVSLTVLDHPAVVSFYRDHGEDVGERPVWNVGPEWREHVVSREPWCVLVSIRLDDEVLDLYAGADGTIVESRRRTVTEVGAPSSQTSTTDTRSARGDGDGPSEDRRGEDVTA